VSRAAPRITSTESESPAPSRFARATSACFGSLSSVTKLPSACRERARQPDRAVASERPDLEDGSRAVQLREEHEELPLRRRDVDGR
jgi:hypothetical protein